MDLFMHIIGITGNALLAIAYVPQIIKLIKTKKGEDLSMMMWINYLVGDILLAIYAYYTKEFIFCSLFAIFTFFNITILWLTVKYGKKKISILKEL
jgi:MtN3 and saliva related transmembrane protein